MLGRVGVRGTTRPLLEVGLRQRRGSRRRSTLRATISVTFSSGKLVPPAQIDAGSCKVERSIIERLRWRRNRDRPMRDLADEDRYAVHPADLRAEAPRRRRPSAASPTTTSRATISIWIYRTMLLSRRIDDKEIQLKNQSLHLFPDQRRGPRSHPGRGRPGASPRLRLVLPVLSRPRAVPHARR